MHEKTTASLASEERRRARTAAIQKFVHEFAPCENTDLLSQMMVTMCRLAADGADRGDVKILNVALRE